MQYGDLADGRTDGRTELLYINVLTRDKNRIVMFQVVGRKLVMVGSGGTGKSCLLNALKCGEFLAMNDPTVYETFTLQLDVDDIQVVITECTTSHPPPPPHWTVDTPHLDISSPNSAGCSGLVVEYRTRNREVAGSTHTRSTASNLEQVA